MKGAGLGRNSITACSARREEQDEREDAWIWVRKQELEERREREAHMGPPPEAGE